MSVKEEGRPGAECAPGRFAMREPDVGIVGAECTRPAVRDAESSPFDSVEAGLARPGNQNHAESGQIIAFPTPTSSPNPPSPDPAPHCTAGHAVTGANGTAGSTRCTFRYCTFGGMVGARVVLISTAP